MSENKTVKLALRLTVTELRRLRTMAGSSRGLGAKFVRRLIQQEWMRHGMRIAARENEGAADGGT